MDMRPRLDLPQIQSQPGRHATCCTPWPRRCAQHGADLALGFDGDGDRCGVVDDEGEEIFADKIGLMLARDLSALHKDATFVVDVKSTGLYATDPVLKANGAKTVYWKTGHSYIKRKTAELGALAGFEKSGHFFFNPPIGRGYDDGIVAAAAILAMLDRNPGKKLSRPEEGPAGRLHLADHEPALRRRGEVRRGRRGGRRIHRPGATPAARSWAARSPSVITVNGVRVALEDGSWVLVRASSNKPEIVVVVESTRSRTTCAPCSARR